MSFSVKQIRELLPLFMLAMCLPAHAGSYTYNYAKIGVAIEQANRLADFPGNFRAIDYNLKENTSSLFRIADLPLEAQKTYLTEETHATSPAPLWMENYLKQLEEVAFKRSGLIQVRVSEVDATQVFYEHRLIVIQKSDLVRPVDELKFLLAHEFSHFLLFSYQISSVDGLTPSGFTALKIFEAPEGSSSQAEWTQDFSDLLPETYYLDHAEVDVTACLLMKRLRANITTSFFEFVLAHKDSALNEKPLPAIIVKELEIRLEALRACKGSP